MTTQANRRNSVEHPKFFSAKFAPIVLIACLTLAVSVCIAKWPSGSAQKKTGLPIMNYVKDDTQGSNGTSGANTSTNADPMNAMAQSTDGIGGLIESLSIDPSWVSSASTIKIAVKAFPLPGRNVTYQYNWSVNGKMQESIHGDSFPSGVVKTGDRITVAVIPAVDGKEYGQFTQTKEIAVHRMPPTLEIKVDKNMVNGGSMVFQLVGNNEDNSKLTYSLEPPLIDGMTVDKDTGIVTWSNIQRANAKYQFTASVKDLDGDKTIKVFEAGAQLR